MPKFYGSVNDLSELTVKLYGGVETITTASGQIRAGGAGNITLFDGTRFVNNTVPILNSQAIDFLQTVTVADPFEVSLIAHFTDGTSAQTIYTATTVSGLYSIAQYGVVMRNENFVSGDDYVDITATYTGQAHKITKLYGSVNTTTIDTAVGTVREGGAGNVLALAGQVFVDKINTISLPSYALSSLGLRYDGAYFNLTLLFSDSTPTETLTGWVDESALSAWGIVFRPGVLSIGTDYIDLSVTSSTSFKTKLIHINSLTPPSS